jgi:hypothetical protein
MHLLLTTAQGRLCLTGMCRWVGRGILQAAVASCTPSATATALQQLTATQAAHHAAGTPLAPRAITPTWGFASNHTPYFCFYAHQRRVLFSFFLGFFCFWVLVSTAKSKQHIQHRAAVAGQT